jgi:hypothetical protein
LGECFGSSPAWQREQYYLYCLEKVLALLAINICSTSLLKTAGRAQDDSASPWNLIKSLSILFANLYKHSNFDNRLCYFRDAHVKHNKHKNKPCPRFIVSAFFNASCHELRFRDGWEVFQATCPISHYSLEFLRTQKIIIFIIQH